MSKTVEEIIKEIPALKAYATNPDVVKQLYKELNPREGLGDLQEGDYVDGADVLLVKVVSTSSYVGCPQCYKKMEVEEGVSVVCNGDRCHGEQRVATRLHKWTMLGGDPTTKVILEFPPFGYKLDDGSKYIAKVVNIKGRVSGVREQKTDGVKHKVPIILVRDMTVISDVRDSLDAPKAEPTPKAAPPLPSATPTSNLPKEKVEAFKTWLRIVGKPVTEEQVKNYVKNNLKGALEDVLPLLKKQGDLYVLA
jgi:hypothetical protein